MSESKARERVHHHGSPSGPPDCGEASSGVLVSAERWDRVNCHNCLALRPECGKGELFWEPHDWHIGSVSTADVVCRTCEAEREYTPEERMRSFIERVAAEAAPSGLSGDGACDQLTEFAEEAAETLLFLDAYAHPLDPRPLSYEGSAPRPAPPAPVVPGKIDKGVPVPLPAWADRFMRSVLRYFSRAPVSVPPRPLRPAESLRPGPYVQPPPASDAPQGDPE